MATNPNNPALRGVVWLYNVYFFFGSFLAILDKNQEKHKFICIYHFFVVSLPRN